MPTSRLRPIDNKRSKHDHIELVRGQKRIIRREKDQKARAVKILEQRLRKTLREIAEVEESLVDLKTADKIKILLNTLSGFISKSLSTSSKHANTSACKIAHVTICSIDAIFALENIALLPALNSERLLALCKRVRNKLDNTKSEAEGIHPTVVDIYRACVGPDTDFKIVHEEPCWDCLPSAWYCAALSTTALRRLYSLQR